MASAVIAHIAITIISFTQSGIEQGVVLFMEKSFEDKQLFKDQPEGQPRFYIQVALHNL